MGDSVSFSGLEDGAPAPCTTGHFNSSDKFRSFIPGIGVPSAVLRLGPMFLLLSKSKSKIHPAHGHYLPDE
jgi:hypothetical protein